MSILDFFRRKPETRSLENPSVSISTATLADLWGAETPSAAGPTVNIDAALKQSVFWTCARVLTETIAALPWQVFEATTAGNVLAKDHALYPVLHDSPNEALTSFVFREVFIGHCLLWGNGYALILGEGDSRRLLLLMPNMVTARAEPSGLFYDVKMGDETTRYPASQIIHVPAFSLDGIKGLSSVLVGARNTIGEAIATQEHSSRFFSNGARPGGILSTEFELKDNAVARLRSQWDKLQGGLANAYRTAVLEQGMKYQPLAMQSDHAQLLETRRLLTELIAGAMRIPPMFVGDYSRMTYASAEQNDLHLAKHTLAPWLKRIEQEFNRKLFAGTAFFCEFNLDGILRGDFKTRIEGLAKGVQSALYTPNEARAFLNLPPKPGGDELFIQQNMAGAQAVASAEIGEPTKGSSNESGTPGV